MLFHMEYIAFDAPNLPQLRDSVELKKCVGSYLLRAAVVVGTTGTLMVAMSSERRFGNLLAVGHDALEMEKGVEQDLYDESICD